MAAFQEYYSFQQLILPSSDAGGLYKGINISERC